MSERNLQWSVLPLVAGVQLGISLYNTALPMVVKERCINATRDPSLNSSSTESWQSALSNFYLTYKILRQLLPIVPGLGLAWLGDRGWRRAPILVPLVGLLLSRPLMLLVLTLDWPLGILWAEGTLTGLCGGFVVFWGGTITLLSLGSAERDRSGLMMRTELTSGIAGVVGCVTSGHLFNVTAFGWRPGVLVVVVCLLIHGLCVLYVGFCLQVPRDCVYQQEVKEVCEQRVQTMTIVLLWLAAVVYDAASSAARNILVLFELMEPLHWNVTQVGYGDASGFLVILSSFLGATFMSRCVSDLTLITIGMLSFAVGMLPMAFATTTYMFYIARALTLFSTMPMPIIQSLLSQQVHGSSYSMVLTSLQLSRKFSAVLCNPLYILVYNHTMNWFPGTVFVASSIITVVTIIPIRILACGVSVGSSYQRVHVQEDSDKDEILPHLTSCTEDIHSLDQQQIKVAEVEETS